MVGLARVERAVTKASVEMTAPTIAKALAEMVLARAKIEAPVGPSGRRGHRPGTLQRSGRASGTRKQGVVRFGGPKVPYAGPVHFGALARPQGGYNLPQPFLYDAADARREAVYARFEAYAQRVLERLVAGG